LHWVRPSATWRDLALELPALALGLAFLALGGSQAHAPMLGHMAFGLFALSQGLTCAPRDAEVFALLPRLMSLAS